MLRPVSCAAFLLGAIWLPFTAEAGLPKYAFSIPPGQTVEGMRAAEQCGLKSRVLVMPAASFRFAGEDSPAGPIEEQTRALMSAGNEAEVYLHIAVSAGTLSTGATERALTDRIAAFLKRMPLSSPAVRGVIVEVAEPITAVDLFTFGLVNLAVTAKGARSDLRLAFVFPRGFTSRHGDIVKRLATYSDVLGISYSPEWSKEAEWIATQALNKPLVLKVDAGQSYLPAMLAAGENVEMVWTQPPALDAMTSLCTVDSFLRRFVTNDMGRAAPAGVPYRIAVDGVDPGEHTWYASGPTSDAVVIARVKGAPGMPKTVRFHAATAAQVEMQWFDPLTGAKLNAGEITKAAQSSDQTCACESEYALVAIHRVGGSADTLVTAVDVRAKADLTVEEVIARWQQYRAAQRQKLDSFMADCFMNLHFESTNFGSGFDISIQFKQFSNRAGLIEWMQTNFYVNGSKFGKNREFPLPQLEPEKVMTQPLELKLNEKYEYKLLGTEKIGDVFCFVVGIEPRVTGETLYSGKIWIDGATFRQVKQYLRQRGENTNVFSNVETQNYELFKDGKGNEFNLIRSITAQQLLNAAGRDFVLQKTYDFSGYAINSAEFEASLTAARNSNDPMFRETETGLRALRKQGTERILDEKPAKRVRSIVAGTMYEGTFSFPIPILGFSVADFNFKNTGAQLSLFFAGPILVTNLSKQYGTRFRLGMDLALSGLPGNNRIYNGDAELKNQTMWNWQEDTGLRATWQATTSLTFTAFNYFSYEHFRGNSEIDKQFILPRNGFSLLPGAELKYAKRGYVLTAQGTRGIRPGWKQFGLASAPEPFYDAFTRYNAGLSKTYFIRKFTKTGWDFSYFGGNQLDRISRYRPSFFSRPRIRGVPGGTDAFDAIALGSVNYGFNVLDFIKFEGTYTYARARNVEESRRFRRFDGAEFNFGTAGPMGTYLQGIISYALHGNVPRYNSRWGAYLLIFKPLR